MYLMYPNTRYVPTHPLCSQKVLRNLFTDIIFFKIVFKKVSSLGGLEPPTSRLTVERANQLRHRDTCKRS